MYRTAASGDAVAIATAYTRAWRETYTGRLPQRVVDARTNLERCTEQWEERLRNNRADIIILAETERAVSGFINIGPNDKATGAKIPGYDAHLYALYLIASAHRQGIGRELLRIGATELLAGGRRSLSLNVLATNPARSFYEHLGARYIGDEEIRNGSDAWIQCAYGWPDVAGLCGGGKTKRQGEGEGR